MPSAPKTGSARRKGDDYQDLTALRLALEHYIARTPFTMHLEFENSGNLDDIVFLHGNHIDAYQVRYSVSPLRSITSMTSQTPRVASISPSSRTVGLNSATASPNTALRHVSGPLAPLTPRLLTLSRRREHFNPQLSKTADEAPQNNSALAFTPQSPSTPRPSALFFPTSNSSHAGPP